MLFIVICETKMHNLCRVKLGSAADKQKDKIIVANKIKIELLLNKVIFTFTICFALKYL